MSPKRHVAVIGAGPAGLAAIKSLMEEGFEVTGFERRTEAGGIWAFSDNPTYTSATSETRAQISKFQTPFSDFPHEDGFPRHPKGAHLGAYYREYASKFGLTDKIRFGTTVESIRRDEERELWLVQVAGESTPRSFDKVVYAGGSETKPVFPVIENRELFEGKLLHGQEYKRPGDFAGMNVVVLGQGNSAADCVLELSSVTKSVAFAHRRGALVVPRMVDGQRFDKLASWKSTRLLFWLGRVMPTIHRWLVDYVFSSTSHTAWGKIEPEFRLEPLPGYAANINGLIISDGLIPALRDGRVRSTGGLRRVVGPKSVEMEDGMVLEDVDAIICCTGYSTPFDLVDSAITFTRPHPDVPPQPDLFYNVFSLKYPDSLAFLNFVVVFDNAAHCRELASLAIAQVFAAKSPLPTRLEMTRQIRDHQAWFANRCATEPLQQIEGLIDTDSWLRWVHATAGTGMYEHLGWTWTGIWFSLRHPLLYLKMAYGVNSPHLIRLFETGKRKAWPEAMRAIMHANEMSRQDLAKTPGKMD